MKNVLIVNDEMVAGGVAKVLINMLKEINYDDVNIDLLILHPHGEMLDDIPSRFNILESTPFFDVVDTSRKNILQTKSLIKLIKRTYWYFLMKVGLMERKIRKERKKIIKKQYDVEIAYKEGFCTIFVAAGDSKKKVNWIHVDYKKNNYAANHMKLMKKAISKIDVEVSPSEDAAASYREVFDIKDEVQIIRNCVNVQEIKEKSKVPCKLSDKFNIVSIGRMHYQKAFLRAIDVIYRLKDYDFHYYIVGDGEERKQIEEKINKYKLNDKISLTGYDPNPFKYVKNGDLFLVPSLYEGIPTVIYEGLIIGTTPILTTLVSGCKEQLDNGRLGIICGNSEDEIYEALKKVLDNKQILETYKIEMKKYSKDNSLTINKFHDLIVK